MPEPQVQASQGQPGIASAALLGLCPRCGARTLFRGGPFSVAFAERCAACGLDVAAFNVGDGPAAFLTLIVGALVVALALTLEVTVHPPFWVHVILWVPFTAAAVLLGLRAGKGALLAAEYRRDAGEARHGAGSARDVAIDEVASGDAASDHGR